MCSCTFRRRFAAGLPALIRILRKNKQLLTVLPPHEAVIKVENYPKGNWGFMKHSITVALAVFLMMPFAHAEQQRLPASSVVRNGTSVAEADTQPQCPGQCVTPQGACTLAGQSAGVGGSCLIQPRSPCVCKTPSGITISGRAR
jgi:hypothetical protein